MASALDNALADLRKTYPGVDAERESARWRVVVPPSYHVGHEAHFGQVATQFLDYVARGALPKWEVPNMIAKYGTTTGALAIARDGAPSAT